MSNYFNDVLMVGAGGAVISGAAAVLVARLTVKWTLGGTKDATREGVLLDRSHEAAFRITDALTGAFEAIAQTTDSAEFKHAVDTYVHVSTLYAPDLLDNEAYRRVNEVTDLIMGHSDWVVEHSRPAVGPGEFGFGGEDADEVARRKATLASWISWVSRTMAHHRRGVPLPADEPARPWPKPKPKPKPKPE